MITKLLKDLDRIEEISGPLLVRKRFNHEKEISSDIDSELTGIIHSPVIGTAKRSLKKQKSINKSYRKR